MKVFHISDTHNRHSLMSDLPDADVIVHSGDFTETSSEEEILSFLNWFIELRYKYKIFVTGNHDCLLWSADDIEDLPDNVFFLQNRSCTIEGVTFFGLGYNSDINLIPKGIDVLVTHEPPLMILDKAGPPMADIVGEHLGNRELRERVIEAKPRYHLFGHAHEAYGTTEQNGTLYSNASLLDDQYESNRRPRIIEV